MSLTTASRVWKENDIRTAESVVRVRVTDGNARHQERVKALGDAPGYGVADKPVYGNGHVRSVLLDCPDHQHGGVNTAGLELQVGISPVEHVALLQV